MKKLFLLLISFLLVFSLGCSNTPSADEWGNEDIEKEPTEEPPVLELTAIPAEDIKIGFISGYTQDFCYTAVCESALHDAAEIIGLEAQSFKTMYNVAPEYECTRVAQILISLGCNVIISVGDELTDGIKSAAKDNPDVYFIASGNDNSLDNMSVYSIDTVSLYYLFGAIAAVKSDTQRIGYIASLSAERIADINAFALGVAAVDSEITVDVTFSDTVDAEYADLTLKQFSAGGCDVFVRHGDGEILRGCESAESATVLDIRMYGGGESSMGITYNLSKLYLPFFDMITSDEWAPVSNRLSLSNGGITTDFSSGEFEDDDETVLYEIIDDISSENFSVFSGEIKNNDGEVEIKNGSELTESEINEMDFLVLGISGTLPEHS